MYPVRHASLHRQPESSKLKLVDGLNKASQRPGNGPSLLLRLVLVSISIILGFANQQHLAAQQVAREAPPPQNASPLPNAPSLLNLPLAVPIVTDEGTLPLTIEADPISRHGNLYSLEGGATITYRGHVIHADRITYDQSTGDITAEGHLLLTGGDNDEYIQASHGTYNLNSQTGKFYDVAGSVGLHGTAKPNGYNSPNPFLFSGKMVVKTGSQNYEIYNGKVTSCLLPNPDWQLSAGRFSLDGDKARARNSTFRLLNVPILFLPYVTHPIDPGTRQSGLLIPVPGYTNTKGYVIGEGVYLTLGRSADLTVMTEFFSLRGYSESASFRYRGAGNDFLTAHFSALQDRGYTDKTTHLEVKQGGEDVTFAFRRKLSSRTRVQGDVEYLSSYVYRQAFNESFNQAVSSDITSIVYAINQQYGYSSSIRADRYQGLKRIPITTLDSGGNTVTIPGQQVRIFHAPSLDFTALDHHIGRSPLLWSLNTSASGLKRTQPNFVSSGIIQRFDLRPELSLPLSGGGWHTMSSIAVRETVYSRSRAVPYLPGQPPIEVTEPVSRISLEIKADARPPIIAREFRAPKPLARFLGPELRHTVEPQLVYSNTRGIDNFLSVLRFDSVDIDSNTNELQYGVTQRLFARRPPFKAKSPKGCAVATPAVSKLDAVPQAPLEFDSQTNFELDANGIPKVNGPPEPLRTHSLVANPCDITAEAPQHEWLSWTLTQKHFFDPTFGAAVINKRRNIFNTTLMFSGIAFLTEPRDTSPLISRFRMRTSSHSDIEWDFDLDTGAKRFTSSNVYFDAHEGPVFGAVSYARLNAPGRFYTQIIDNNNPGKGTLVSSAVSDFSQLWFLLGFGTPSRPGPSAAANAGLDLKHGSLQYGSLQANYNWNCCGFSAEYRKYELGAVRNEGAYKFSFTLANIGTAGNLRRTQRLF